MSEPATRADVVEVLLIVRDVIRNVQWGDYPNIREDVNRIERRASALASKLTGTGAGTLRAEVPEPAPEHEA